MRNNLSKWSTTPPPKSPEEIRNRLQLLAEKKKRLTATAQNFRSGRNDQAIAADMIILESRMYELYWCLSAKPIPDA